MLCKTKYCLAVDMSKYTFKADLHCHTISSGHAFSTIQENAVQAEKNGIDLIAITDHAPSMPHSTCLWHFENLFLVPRKIGNTYVLRGAEANIIDYDGKLDIYDELLGQLDLVIASLHDACIAPGSIEQNTNALIGACENPYVNVIGHCGNPVYPVDYPRFLNAAKANDKIIEFNSRSLDLRGASRPNCKKVAQICARMGIKVAADSDAHICYKIGDFAKTEQMFSEVGMPPELIVTSSAQKVIDYLKSHNRPMEGF